MVSLPGKGATAQMLAHLASASGHIEGQRLPAGLEAGKGQRRVKQLCWVAGPVRGVQGRLGAEELGAAGAQGGGGGHAKQGVALAERWRQEGAHTVRCLEDRG